MKAFWLLWSLRIESAAAWICLMPGSRNLPARLRTLAILKWFFSE